MPKQYIMFWKPKETNGAFSQWYPSEFEEKGIVFSNAEQYLMYHKALLFNDKKTAAHILKARCPNMIKSLGRQVSNFNEEIWELNREKIAIEGNYLKFSQNYDLLEFLFKCPDGVDFVETSPYDRIWGIGFKKDVALKHKREWGRNLLGKVLKLVKEKLHQEYVFE